MKQKSSSCDSKDKSELPYKIIRSKRKTLAIQISKDLEILVRAPMRASVKSIEVILQANTEWIKTNLALQEEKNRVKASNALTGEQIIKLREQAREIIPKRVDYYSSIMGVNPVSIKITSATTRWGSCSSRNGLCFSYRVMLLPSDAIDYIVVHELAHITVRNHGKDFYNLISKYLPDYKDRVKTIRQIEKRI